MKLLCDFPLFLPPCSSIFNIISHLSPPCPHFLPHLPYLLSVALDGKQYLVANSLKVSVLSLSRFYNTWFQHRSCLIQNIFVLSENKRFLFEQAFCEVRFLLHLFIHKSWRLHACSKRAAITPPLVFVAVSVRGVIMYLTVPLSQNNLVLLGWNTFSSELMSHKVSYHCIYLHMFPSLPIFFLFSFSVTVSCISVHFFCIILSNNFTLPASCLFWLLIKLNPAYTLLFSFQRDTNVIHLIPGLHPAACLIIISCHTRSVILSGNLQFLIVSLLLMGNCCGDLPLRFSEITCQLVAN